MNEEKILELIQEENSPNPLAYVKELVKPMMRNKIEQYIIECEYCPNRFTGFKSIPFKLGKAILINNIERINIKIGKPYKKIEYLNSFTNQQNIWLKFTKYFNLDLCANFLMAGTAQRIFLNHRQPENSLPI